MQALSGSRTFTEEDFYEMPTITERLSELEKQSHTWQGVARGAGLVGVLLLGGIIWWINSSLLPSIERIGKQVEKIDYGLIELDKRVGKLETIQAAPYVHTLKKASEKASDPANIQKVSNALAEAKKADIKIPADTVQDSASQFIDASKTTPKAWDAVLASLDYRSFLNDDQLPVDKTAFVLRQEIDVYVQAAIGGMVQYWGFTNFVSSDKAFVYQKLDNPKPPPSNISFEYLLVKNVRDGQVLLDDHRIKNVIFQGINIQYRGGAVLLENVYFVNCTFTMIRSNASEKLANAVLEKSAVSLKTS